METLIQTTFLILLFFAVINTATSVCLYVLQKKPIFAWMSAFWIALILNFIIQASAQEGQLKIIMGYGFALLPLNLLGFVSLKFLKLKYPVKMMSLIALGSIILTGILEMYDLSFTAHAMPLAVGTAAPLFYTAYIFLVRHRKISSAIMKVESIVLVAQGIHCFNFAIFREDPSAQLWGWSLSYALYQLLACILPTLTLEEYYKDEKERLNDLVDLRTAELSSATAALASALDQKNMMVKVLTHDISNCLVPLAFYVKTLGRNKLANTSQEDFEKALGRIDVSAERISSMVMQVRNYEALASRKGNSLRYCDLRRCLKESLDQFKESIQQKNLQVTISVDPRLSEDVKVLTDPASFVNSVLSNLISNSIKFCHPGGELKIIANALEGENLEISFKDNGVGIPADDLGNVFSFNHNTSRDGTNGEKGTGFGLPILKKYIEVYEGDISVESREQTESTPGYTCFKMVLKSKN